MKKTLETRLGTGNAFRTGVLLALLGNSSCHKQTPPSGEAHTLFDGLPAERMAEHAQQWNYSYIENLAHIIHYRYGLTYNASNIASDTHWQRVEQYLNSYLDQVRTYHDQHAECFERTTPTCEIPAFNMTIFTRREVEQLAQLIGDAQLFEARQSAQREILHRCNSTPPQVAARPELASRFNQQYIPDSILLASLLRRLQELHRFSYMRPDFLRAHSHFSQ